MICPHCGKNAGDVLKPEDLAVIKGICDGLPNVEIGKRLGIGTRTVKGRLTRIYKILDINWPSEHERGFDHRRVILACRWHCELFQVGLRELGILVE